MKRAIIIFVLLFTTEYYFAMKVVETDGYMFNNLEPMGSNMGHFNSNHIDNNKPSVTDNLWNFFYETTFHVNDWKFKTWVVIDYFFHQVGFYKKRPLQYGEWFLGTAIGVGWYPKFLRFGKYFRIGFFEIQYNFLSLIRYLIRVITNSNAYDTPTVGYSQRGIGGLTIPAKEEKRDKHINIVKLSCIFGPINLSLVNLQFFNGFIKFRFFDLLKIILFIVEKRDIPKNIEEESYGRWSDFSSRTVGNIFSFSLGVRRGRYGVRYGFLEREIIHIGEEETTSTKNNIENENDIENNTKDCKYYMGLGDNDEKNPSSLKSDNSFFTVNFYSLFNLFLPDIYISLDGFFGDDA